MHSWGPQQAADFLGHGQTIGNFTPKKIVALTGKHIVNFSVYETVAEADNDGCNVLALDDGGSLFAWGKNLNYNLGVGDCNPRKTPVYVSTLEHEQILLCGLGARCGFAFSKSRKLYM